jgi:hypothetical protein
MVLLLKRRPTSKAHRVHSYAAAEAVLCTNFFATIHFRTASMLCCRRRLTGPSFLLGLAPPAIGSGARVWARLLLLPAIWLWGTGGSAWLGPPRAALYISWLECALWSGLPGPSRAALLSLPPLCVRCGGLAIGPLRDLASPAPPPLARGAGPTLVPQRCV